MRVSIAVLIMLLSACAAFATPDVVLTSGSGTFVKKDINPLGGGRYEIVIDFDGAAASSYELTVTSDASDIIERFVATVSGAGSTAILVFDGDGGSGEIQSVERLTYLPPATRAPARLTVNIDLREVSGTGRVGDASGNRLEAHRFSQIRCKELTADIEIIEDAVTLDGEIMNIEVTEGDMTGDITARELGLLNVTSGDIGAPGANVDINISGDAAFQAESIYANIDVGGRIRTFNVRGTSPGTLLADGVFAGSLSCDTLEQSTGGPFGLAMAIWGDLQAQVTIDDELLSNSGIAVGRELTSTGMIDFTQSDGLQGRVIVGWLAPETGLWTGDAAVGSATLSPKGAYTQTGLGGGGVGLAPYGFYRQASDPAYAADGTPPTIAAATDQRIDIEHYGVLSLQPGAGSPYRVWEFTGVHCGGNPPSGGTCVETQGTEITGDWTWPGVSDRTASLEGDIEAGKHYHFQLNKDTGAGEQHLETDDLLGGQLDVDQYIYVVP